jgi:uncharacterized protein (TIGR02147 family)
MNSYRDTLKQQFAEKRKKNSRFSMRAFAQVLGLSPAGLSQILNGKKDLSLDRALEISKKLKLPTEESESFLFQVQLERAKSTSLKDNLLQAWENRYGKIASQDLQDLSVEQFRLISEWYGLAIYEALKSGTTDRPMTARQLAKLFTLDINTVDLTLSRLVKLKLIQALGKLGYVVKADRLSIDSPTPSEAIQNYYKAVIERAIYAIETKTHEQKIVGAQSITLAQSQLSIAERYRDEYWSKLIQLSVSSKDFPVADLKRVYKHFEILFPVSLPIQNQIANHTEKKNEK